MKILVFLSLIACINSCKTTDSTSDARSRNGDEVSSDYESVALIQATYGDGTGVLLGPRLLLTVNHVTEGTGRVSVYPNFAQRNPTRPVGTDEIRVLSTDPRMELALVKLSSRVSGRYSKLSTTAASQSDLTTVGYGINPTGNTSYKAKLKANMKLRGYRGVKQDLGAPSSTPVGSGETLMGELVPGRRDQLPCSGDSGGPVFQRHRGEDVVVGVMSHIGETDGNPTDVYDYCRRGKNARFVPVHLYRSWLDEQAAAMGERIGWVDLGGNIDSDPTDPDPVEPDPVEPDPVEPDPVVVGNPLPNGWFLTREEFPCDLLLQYFYPQHHYYRQVLTSRQCQMLVGHGDGRVVAMAKYQRSEIPLRGLARLATTSRYVDLGTPSVTIRILLSQSKVQILGLTEAFGLVPE